MTQRVVTLDFGSSGIRAVQVAGKDHSKAEKIGFAPLPRGAVDGGEIKDSAAVTVALKELWAASKFRTKKVAFAVANGNVAVREVVTDDQGHEELLSALAYQAEDDMGIDPADVTLDYHVLDEFEEPFEDGEGTRSMIRVLMIVARRDMLATFIDAIQAADLVPVLADLGPFALVRAITPEENAPNIAEAIIEIGADLTTIVIHQNGQPRYVRTYPGMGGNAITDELVRVFGWKRREAESTKYAVGIRTQAPAAAPLDSVFAVEEPAFQQPDPQEEALEQISGVISTVASRAIQDIRETLGYFLESSPEIDTLSRVVLSGGGSLLTGLAPRLGSELRVRVEYTTPHALITLTPQAEIPAGLAEQQFTLTTGLALEASL